MDQRSRRDLGAIIFRNTIAASIGSWFTRIANFLFIIYAVRVLGEVELGRYATIVAVVGLLSVFAELGMAQYVERSIAQDSRRVEDLFWNLVLLRAALGLSGIVVISAFAFAIYEREIATGVFIFSLTFLLSAILVPLTIILTANERFDLSTGVKIIGQLATVGLGFILLEAGLGFYALLLTGFIAMPLQIVAAIFIVRRYKLGPIPFRIQPHDWGGFVRASLPFGVTSLALTLNFNVDTVILGLFRPDADVGWYNASYRLIFNAVGIVGVYLVVMTPSLAREHRISSERVANWVRTSISWMIVFGLPAGAGLCLLSANVVGTLYGADYAPAASVVAIIAWDIPLYVLLSLFGNVTAATERERPAAAIYIGGAVANVILNFAFIPLFGMHAAAAITVGTDFLTAVLFFILLRDMIPFRPALAGTLVRVGAATGVMVATLLAIDDLPLVVAIVAGGTIYLGCATLLKVIDISDLLSKARSSLQHRQPRQSAT